MNVAGNGVKCPLCGESRRLTPLGKVNIIGLDPLMEKFICENVCYTYIPEEGYRHGLRKLCNTEFYVAPLPNKVIEKARNDDT